jgi:hypothetical protein
MKQLIETEYIFDASLKTVDLSSIRNFDVKKLYAILNITRNQIIYAIGTTAYGLASISGNVLTLVYDTTYQDDTDLLGIIYDDQVTEIPADDTDSTATAVRALPQHVSRIGFAKAITGGVDPDFFATPTIGAGMGVNQTGGNLVLTSGTTARSETIIRSLASWKGGVRLRARVTASNRIINQSLFIELVDVIGDGLAYVINSATSITVTIPNNTFTSQNVGQSVTLQGFSGTGTFLSGRYPIASVSGDNVTFTVSGFAVGSGTCSITGLNFYRLLYQNATPTNLTFNTQRNGYANTDVTATIQTTASPGHLAILTGNDLLSSLHDQLVASGTGVQSTLRATAVENIPDDKDLRLQVRVLNLGTAPASSITWTIGLLSVGNYANQDVAIQDIRQMSPVALPVEILRNVSQAVTGTVTANVSASTNRTGFIAGAGIWYDDSSTNLGIAATFTGTSRDLTVTATATAMANAATYAHELVVSAESDQTGTLWLEVSRDNTNWRRVKSIATTAVTGGGFYAEIVHRPSWRYARVGFTNGGVAQTRFAIGSILKAI